MASSAGCWLLVAGSANVLLFRLKYIFTGCLFNLYNHQSGNSLFIISLIFSLSFFYRRLYPSSFRSFIAIHLAFHTHILFSIFDVLITSSSSSSQILCVLFCFDFLFFISNCRIVVRQRIIGASLDSVFGTLLNFYGFACIALIFV